MESKKIKILYFGNMLSKHGKSISVIEELTPLLQEHYTVIAASDKKNPFFRLIDLVITFFRHVRSTDYILLDTFSTANFYSTVLLSQFAIFFNKKYIPILHGGNLPNRLAKSRFLSDLVFSNSYMNVAPSGYLKSAFEKFNYETKFIPNNIKIENYSYKLRSSPKPKLLYVRAFHELYNPTLAIWVFNDILKKFPDAELCMVGAAKDSSIDDVKVIIQKLEIEDKVKITGLLKKEDWIKLSESYDIFINTTNFDNTPISVIEAMALGFPVVSTNAGGLPFLIDDRKNGILVAKRDKEAFVEAIFEILGNKNFASSLSKNAREKADSFSWHKVEKMWLELLN